MSDKNSEKAKKAKQEFASKARKEIQGNLEGIIPSLGEAPVRLKQQLREAYRRLDERGIKHRYLKLPENPEPLHDEEIELTQWEKEWWSENPEPLNDEGIERTPWERMWESRKEEAALVLQARDKTDEELASFLKGHEDSGKRDKILAKSLVPVLITALKGDIVFGDNNPLVARGFMRRGPAWLNEPPELRKCLTVAQLMIAFDILKYKHIHHDFWFEIMMTRPAYDLPGSNKQWLPPLFGLKPLGISDAILYDIYRKPIHTEAKAESIAIDWYKRECSRMFEFITFREMQLGAPKKLRESDAAGHYTQVTDELRERGLSDAEMASVRGHHAGFEETDYQAEMRSLYEQATEKLKLGQERDKIIMEQMKRLLDHIG